MTRHTIFDAAKWFTEKNGGKIGSKKLQKLCYYAQAWSYALRDKPLFHGKFRAWAHGPVNKKLWKEFQDVSYRKIKISDFKGRDLEFVPFTEEEERFLERVWATYGQFNGSELEALTHQEKPWMEQREGLHPYEKSNNVILKKSMRDYYRSLYIQEEDT